AGAIASGENCGLRLDPAKRRTSTSCTIVASRNMSTNISQGRVEWPMVHNVPGGGCTGSIRSCCRDEDEAALTAPSLGWRHPVQSRGRGCDERFLQWHGPHRADPEVPAQVS